MMTRKEIRQALISEIDQRLASMEKVPDFESLPYFDTEPMWLISHPQTIIQYAIVIGPKVCAVMDPIGKTDKQQVVIRTMPPLVAHQYEKRTDIRPRWAK
jgi:hypothetical protein